MEKKFSLLMVSGVVFIAFVAIAYSNGSVVVSSPVINFVSGTEYWSSSGAGITEKASTIISVVNYKGDPYNIDSCTATIYYPDKTVYGLATPMKKSPVPGNWYSDVPVPSEEGNYEQYVVCKYNGDKTISTSKSFHVNPALNYLKVIGADVLSVGTNLSNTNITLHANIDNTRTDLNARINKAETNLDNLIDSVNATITSQLTSAEANLNTKMTNVNLEIKATVKDTGAEIISKINTTETNLNNLIDSVNKDLSKQLHAANATLLSKITDVDANIVGKIENSTATITARISSAETNLDKLINDVNKNLTNKLNAVNADLDTTLKNVNLTLYTEISTTREVIRKELLDVNGTLTDLIIKVTDDIDDYLKVYLPGINQTVTKIYTDTQWIVSNAATSSEMKKRFDSVDSNLKIIEDFCSTGETNSSALCSEVYSMRDVINKMRAEQGNILLNINQTTTNTWNLLSGDITNSINNILLQLGIIRETAFDINETVTEIKRIQEEQIQIRVIS